MKVVNSKKILSGTVQYNVILTTIPTPGSSWSISAHELILNGMVLVPTTGKFSGDYEISHVKGYGHLNIVIHASLRDGDILQVIDILSGERWAMEYNSNNPIWCKL